MLSTQPKQGSDGEMNNSDEKEERFENESSYRKEKTSTMKNQYISKKMQNVTMVRATKTQNVSAEKDIKEESGDLTAMKNT